MLSMWLKRVKRLICVHGNMWKWRNSNKFYWPLHWSHWMDASAAACADDDDDEYIQNVWNSALYQLILLSDSGSHSYCEFRCHLVALHATCIRIWVYQPFQSYGMRLRPIQHTIGIRVLVGVRLPYFSIMSAIVSDFVIRISVCHRIGNIAFTVRMRLYDGQNTEHMDGTIHSEFRIRGTCMSSIESERYCRIFLLIRFDLTIFECWVHSAQHKFRMEIKKKKKRQIICIYFCIWLDYMHHIAIDCLSAMWYNYCYFGRLILHFLVIMSIYPIALVLFAAAAAAAS